MKRLVEILKREQCSLVVENTAGEVTTYGKPGVRDLVWLLDNEPERLCGARVADKVIGRAAAALLVNGVVVAVHGEVMSRLALPLLEDAGIAVTWGELVDAIVVPAGDTRCRLEEIVAPAATSVEAEALLRAHFAAKAAENQSKTEQN